MGSDSVIVDREDLFSLPNLHSAYLQCRRRKRDTINALRFESRLLDNLCDLRDELRSRSYHPSASICFVHKKPKLREVFAADFRDRVVHHLLVGYLEPLYERLFCHDSYACRRGRGTHAAVARLRSFLDKVTGLGARRAWYLKEDISGFFMNLRGDILLDLLCRRVKREEVLWLARVIITHRCTENYRFKGDPRLLERIPPHKTLFKVEKGRGLPIGNLTSQFFANVYLNELDQMVKRELRCRYYLRYCDDFVLLDPDPERLAAWHLRIEEFLAARLSLRLNESQHCLRPVSSGIDFLGYVTRRSHTLVRRRVVNACRQRLAGLQADLAVRTGAQITGWRYPARETQFLRAVFASYLGHFKWADSRGLRDSFMEHFPVLGSCFLLDPHNRLTPRYELPKPARCFGLHAAYPLWEGLLRPATAQPVLIFFPRGDFYEFYGAQAELAVAVLGLTPVPGLCGWELGCGFHRRWLRIFLNRARDAGCHVAVLAVLKDGRGGRLRKLVRVYKGEAMSGTTV